LLWSKSKWETILQKLVSWWFASFFGREAYFGKKKRGLVLQGCQCEWLDRGFSVSFGKYKFLLIGSDGGKPIDSKLNFVPTNPMPRLMDSTKSLNNQCKVVIGCGIETPWCWPFISHTKTYKMIIFTLIFSVKILSKLKINTIFSDFSSQKRNMLSQKFTLIGRCQKIQVIPLQNLWQNES
jgi:hypothetical protein